MQSIDPRTGDAVTTTIEQTTTEEVDHRAAAAAAAAPALAPRAARVRLLREIAEQLESRREEIKQVGARETALAEARLEGELTRTVYQARFFADVVEDGGFLEATIDHEGPTPMGPGPDLRRMLLPLGPVAVFGASNFPLAFSVPGGDTISALAAGCPVVVKAHDSHPQLSALTFEALREAVSRCDLPEDLVSVVFGLDAGARLVGHPDVRAVGFTGSLSGGKALMGIIDEREEPIPFYGEMSSLNVVVVTEAAAAEGGAGLGEAMVGSITGSAGQFCTKPGLVMLPQGEAGDGVLAGARDAIDGQQGWTLLNEGIASSYGDALGERQEPTARGGSGEGPADVASALYEVTSEQLTDAMLEEMFGPAAVVVRYAPGDEEQLIARVPASLTATIRTAEDDDDELVGRIDAALVPKAGRLLHNGWPTGVIVGWAQHHGGPWPSTNTVHTSVGATSVRRFQRPVAWQSAPESVLPEELRESYDSIPRRVDGQLHLPA